MFGPIKLPIYINNIFDIASPETTSKERDRTFNSKIIVFRLRCSTDLQSAHSHNNIYIEHTQIHVPRFFSVIILPTHVFPLRKIKTLKIYAPIHNTQMLLVWISKFRGPPAQCPSPWVNRNE